MALSNKVDPDHATQALARWLAAQIRSATEVVVTNVEIPSASGMSCETILFDASWEAEGREVGKSYVARVAPVGDAGLFPEYDLDREARVMRALAGHSPVPAPTVVWTEDDPELFGAPFLVMERVEGRAPADDPTYAQEGWVLELKPEQQGLLIDNAVDTVAAVSTVNWQSLGLEVLDRPHRGRRGIDQQIGFCEELYRTGNRGRPDRILEAGLAWLRENAPKDEPIVLCWGDARIGNMLFDDEQGVAAALDWELATLGSPRTDLGYFLYALRLWSEGHGAPSPPGFPSRDEVISRWEHASGCTADHVDYYEILGAVFGAASVMRGMYLMIDAGLVPADSQLPTNNPASVLLADYLGIDGPAGRTTDWVGHR